MSQRGQLEALLNLLGHPWPWDAALSNLVDEAVAAEEVIARVRRGAELDSVTLFSTDGPALHVTAYGFTEDEARRNREELVRWLTATGIPLVDEQGRAL